MGTDDLSNKIVSCSCIHLRLNEEIVFCKNFSFINEEIGFVGILVCLSVFSEWQRFRKARVSTFFILIYISVDGKDYVGGDTICVFFLLVFLVVGCA